MPNENRPFRLLMPLTWRHQITDRFNAPRKYTFAPRKLQLHEGIDFAPIQPITETLFIRAAQRGIVDKVDFSAQGYGHYVRIVHRWGGDTYITWYGHLSETRTRENAFVNAGDIIGIAGSTGFSTGIHLHLTLQHLGQGLKNYVVDDVLNPESFLVASLDTMDEAWWVADLTVEDGAEMNPGEPFRKTWKLRNAGTRAWSAGYTLAFFKDTQMTTVSSVPLPAALPGEEREVSVDLVAPVTPGEYRSTWKPRSASGEFFDYEQYTSIRVRPPISIGVSEMRFVDDITFPDGTAVKPGQPFRKTWRVRNTGQTEWGAGYSFAYFSGEKMSAADSISLPSTPKGGERDLSLDLVAPLTPGLHRTTWKARDPQGNFFEFEMYAEINVIAAPLVEEAAFVGDVILLQPGQSYKKTWRVRNTGQTRWGEGYALAFVSGTSMGAAVDAPIPPAKPDELALVSVTLTAPSVPGVYAGIWRLKNSQGRFFGAPLTAQIEVLA